MTIQVAERHSGESYKNWNEIPASIQDLILELGRFAFTMLNRQQLIFTHVDLQMHSIAQEAKSLGLLVLADTTSSDDGRLWMFSHLTLQESLAARYVATRKATTLPQVVRLVEYLGPESSHLRTFWMLLTARLDEEKADCLINGLLTRARASVTTTPAYIDSSDSDSHMPTGHQFPLDVVDCLSTRLNDHDMRRLAEELLSEKLGGRSGERLVERRCKHGCRASGEEFLTALLLAWVELCPESTHATLATGLRGMGKDGLAEALTATATSLAQSKPQMSLYHRAVDKSLSAAVNLDLAILCYSEHSRHRGNSCHSMPSLAAVFQCTQAKILCSVHPAVTRAYDAAIGAHADSVSSVYISGFMLHAELQRMPESLIRCQSITALHFQSCEGFSWQIFAMVKGSCLCLRQFRLVDCNLADRASPALVVNRRLRPAISIRTSHQQPAQHMVEAIADLPHLREFWLLQCRGVNDIALQTICLALRCMPHLAHVHIDCRFEEESLAILLANLTTRAWPELKVLKMSEESMQRMSTAEGCSFMKAVEGHPSLHHLAIMMEGLNKQWWHRQDAYSDLLKQAKLDRKVLFESATLDYASSQHNEKMTIDTGYFRVTRDKSCDAE
eukprot:scpid63091/ scgid8076/ 